MPALFSLSRFYFGQNIACPNPSLRSLTFPFRPTLSLFFVVVIFLSGFFLIVEHFPRGGLVPLPLFPGLLETHSSFSGTYPGGHPATGKNHHSFNPNRPDLHHKTLPTRSLSRTATFFTSSRPVFTSRGTPARASSPWDLRLFEVTFFFILSPPQYTLFF